MSEKETYEELAEKASKGPFEVEYRTVSNNDGLIAIAENPLQCGMELDYASANARLIAHTLNEFPKLVEALEGFVALVADEGGFNGSFADVDQALKDAKEVGV